MFHSELGVQLICDGTIVDIAYGREQLPDGTTLVAVPIDDRDIERIRDEVTAPGSPRGCPPASCPPASTVSWTTA
jgi:hypothetical protein